jgi:hypothetical protein
MINHQQFMPEHMIRATKEGTLLHTILNNCVETSKQLMKEKREKLDNDVKVKFVDPINVVLRQFLEIEVQFGQDYFFCQTKVLQAAISKVLSVPSFRSFKV